MEMVYVKVVVEREFRLVWRVGFLKRYRRWL